jgi:hypothetical protein
MNLILRLSMLLCLTGVLFSNLSFSQTTPAPASESKEVEGVGIAAGQGQGAYDQALSRALRNAVERSVGVMVTSESLVKNSQLLEDTIYSKVQGYVQEYTVTEDNKGEGDVYRIKVKAKVLETQLESDLQGIKILMQAKGNPKTLVLLEENWGSADTTEKSATHMIEDFFISKAFQLVDASQIESSQETTELTTEQTQSLKSRYGADLILKGSASGQLASQTTAYGVPVFVYSATLSLKAFQADTGVILASFTESTVGRAGSIQEASQKALSEAFEKNREGFLKSILEAWRDSVLNTSEILVTVSKCSSEKRNAIMTGLKSIEGVKNLHENNYQNEHSELSLEVDGAAVKTLDQKIVESIPGLVLISKSGNRLDFEIQ